MFSLPAAAVVVVATSSLTSISDFDLHAIPLVAWHRRNKEYFKTQTLVFLGPIQTRKMVTQKL
jgi:hypothetical protein